MSIQKQFILRYREDGHLRFQIPAQVCQRHIAQRMTDGLRAMDGVYRVNLYPRQGKLSIRFQESVCDYKTLARQLSGLLSELEQAGVFKPQTATTHNNSWHGKVKAKFTNLKVTRWAKQKITEVQETAQAAKIIGKLGMKKPKVFIRDPEKAAIDFFNDILVLFLIKLHWDDITQKWLIKPFRHRYEWMALFYMFFLLVRARRKK